MRGGAAVQTAESAEDVDGYDAEDQCQDEHSAEQEGQGLQAVPQRLRRRNAGTAISEFSGHETEQVSRLIPSAADSN